jgi:cellulose synthase/poly-beta-1,6-N-acetylglucosamine synthase-like glycosyltransferase
MIGIVLVAILVAAARREAGDGLADRGTATWWLVTIVGHAPFAMIFVFLVAGLIERLGYFWSGRAPRQPGRLPATVPTVCVQLPMFNEHAVAARVIEAACSMRWPADRLEVQVLDDSTDADTRRLVDAVCARMRAAGVDCHVLRRERRDGYKAGALEAGRLATDAEFLVVFDSDFLPPVDFLERAIPHFFHADGTADEGLALVQAQWGHLNHDESPLTRSQSLWVDDHHTLQMSWRAATWGFVNFTGTAGVWRASAIESVGGWRAASLVEDCELSFRHLFAGYRTTFVKEIVAPAELPATMTAYKAQQKRWTQGWVQLQRMHLGTLLFRHRDGLLRRAHLVYHMCISWQWPMWALWLTFLPFMIHTGHWFGSFGLEWGLAVYLAPSVVWLATSSILASVETRYTYANDLDAPELRRRLGRVVPYMVINTGMLPHQLSAFTEGLFGPMHSEFERTPKSATVTSDAATPSGRPALALVRNGDEVFTPEWSAGAVATLAAPVRTPLRTPLHAVEPPAEADAETNVVRRRYQVKIHWPYVSAEGCYVAYQFAWAVLFAINGLWLPTIGAIYLAACVLYLLSLYGDHLGRRWFGLVRSE